MIAEAGGSAHLYGVSSGGALVMEAAAAGLADAIAASIPQAERLTLEGQVHVVDPRALAPVLQRFFGA